MERGRSGDRKKSLRIPTSLKARYCVKDERQEEKDCTVINISLNGAGLAFYTPEAMEEGSMLSLKMIALEGKTTITVDGIVRWVKQGKKDFLCGIKLTEVLDAAKQVVLGLH